MRNHTALYTATSNHPGVAVKQLVLLAFIMPCLWLSSLAWCIDAVDFDSDEQLTRYQQLTYELRCPKCQNQNLIDSDSQISQDLRREVARLIRDGKSDQEIKRHMVSMYGDFILYRPPVQTNTIVLWLGPIVMAGVGLLVFAVILVKRMRADMGEDSDEGGELDIDTTGDNGMTDTPTEEAVSDNHTSETSPEKSPD